MREGVIVVHTHRYHVGAECSPQRGLGGGEG